MISSHFLQLCRLLVGRYISKPQEFQFLPLSVYSFCAQAEVLAIKSLYEIATHLESAWRLTVLQLKNFVCQNTCSSLHRAMKVLMCGCLRMPSTRSFMLCRVHVTVDMTLIVAAINLTITRDRRIFDPLTSIASQQKRSRCVVFQSPLAYLPIQRQLLQMMDYRLLTTNPTCRQTLCKQLWRAVRLVQPSVSSCMLCQALQML
jgi:hypothetical protein